MFWLFAFVPGLYWLGPYAYKSSTRSEGMKTLFYAHRIWARSQCFLVAVFSAYFLVVSPWWILGALGIYWFLWIELGFLEWAIIRAHRMEKRKEIQRSLMALHKTFNEASKAVKHERTRRLLERN